MEYFTSQKNVWVHGPEWIVKNCVWFALSFSVGMMIMQISEEVIAAQGKTSDVHGHLATWNEVPIPAGQEQAARELYHLIDAHPSEEVRQDLKARIVDGEVIVGYATIPWQEHQRPVAEFLFMQTSYGIRKIFVVDPKRLLLNPEYSIAQKQVMLYHGWIHVKQQREHRYPEWLSMMRLDPIPLAADGLKTFFEYEAGAFLEECHLATRLGVTAEIPHCQALEHSGRRAMRLELVKTYALVPSLLPALYAFTDAAMKED